MRIWPFQKLFVIGGRLTHIPVYFAVPKSTCGFPEEPTSRPLLVTCYTESSWCKDVVIHQCLSRSFRVHAGLVKEYAFFTDGVVRREMT